MSTIDDIAHAAQGIRRRVMEHTISNNGGYLSQACSSAEILAAIYLRIASLGQSAAPLKPASFSGVPSAANRGYASGGAYNGAHDPKRDRFFLSPAHYALVLYATLIEVGRMSEDGLEDFNRDGSTVEMIGAEHSPGFEMMGGALAQTLSQAAGIAAARKARGDSGRVFAFLSDGEFQEGQTWEAIQALSHYRLDNTAVYVDINGQQCDGTTESVMRLEPLASRVEAFGGRCVSVDGHDIAGLIDASTAVSDGRPLFVLCYTDPCRGVALLEKRRPKLHYVRFTSPEEREEYRRYYETRMTAGGAVGGR